jgi:hypothetical protein
LRGPDRQFSQTRPCFMRSSIHEENHIIITAARPT